MTVYDLDVVGNAERGAIYRPERVVVNGHTLILPSWADQLESQGARWREGTPFATQECSVEELVAQNMVGITLLIPRPEPID